MHSVGGPELILLCVSALLLALGLRRVGPTMLATLAVVGILAGPISPAGASPKPAAAVASDCMDDAKAPPCAVVCANACQLLIPQRPSVIRAARPATGATYPQAQARLAGQSLTPDTPVPR